MIRFFILLIISLSISFPAYSLNQAQREEIQKTIVNMQALMPRRVDAITTISWTWMKGDTWYMNTTMNTGGRTLSQSRIDMLRNWIKDQYCRPPYEYLDAGLVITNQYYDENDNFLFAASASKRICGR